MLCATRHGVDQAIHALALEGFPTVNLEGYTGTPPDAATVGTIKRAKGFEFKPVLIPDVSLLQPTSTASIDDAEHERSDFRREYLDVATTRAREGLLGGDQALRSAPHDSWPANNLTPAPRRPQMPISMSLSGIPNDPSVVASALLQHQFFPNVKSPGEELPPFFSSTTFTQKVANDLQGVKPNRRVSYVTFRTRRFDGLVRRLGLPHPVPYARLIQHLTAHWEKLIPFLESAESMIKPRPCGLDGRLIAMDYDASRERVFAATKAAQGHRYVVKADISNFFPSLYTHSIDWALRGIAVAKDDSNHRTWQAKLDALTRGIHYDETSGVMIGPAVSNILSELVLQRVDSQLRDSGYSFVRYIDDFTTYLDTREQAEAFVSELDRALTSYRLVLNTKKTTITSLRPGIGDAWIGQLGSLLPTDSGAASAIRFLQQCELLAQQNPQASVLTYGVKALLNDRGCPNFEDIRPTPTLEEDIPILDELTRLCYFHPHLSCFVARQLNYVASALQEHDKIRIASQLSTQLHQAARRFETDTTLWMIYSISNILGRPIPWQLTTPLLDMEDDLVWVALASTSTYARRAVVDRVGDIANTSAVTTQEHWLSRYELFRVDALSPRSINADLEQPWFDAAKHAGLALSTVS